jgi:hypothetical protein
MPCAAAQPARAAAGELLYPPKTCTAVPALTPHRFRCVLRSGVNAQLKLGLCARLLLRLRLAVRPACCTEHKAAFSACCA